MSATVITRHSTMVEVVAFLKDAAQLDRRIQVSPVEGAE